MNGPVCPTTCDPDCAARCHEVHNNHGKREHEISDCPAIVGYELDRYCSDIIDLLTFGGGVPVPEAARELMRAKVEDRERRLQAEAWSKCVWAKPEERKSNPYEVG